MYIDTDSIRIPLLARVGVTAIHPNIGPYPQDTRYKPKLYQDIKYHNSPAVYISSEMVLESRFHVCPRSRVLVFLLYPTDLGEFRVIN